MNLLATSIHGLISEALERIEDPNPMAVAEVVVNHLDDDALRHEAKRGIAEKVRVIYSRQRGKAVPAGSARWAAVSDDNSTGELDLARLTIFNGQETKRLLDCDRADLNGAIADHERIARAHEGSAEQLARLARMLQRQKVSTVRELDAAKVREVFHA